MPTGFYDEPPSSLRPSTIDICRVPTGKSVRFVSLSPKPKWIVTHWIGGKSVRCSEGACICQQNPIEGRSHGYLIGITKGRTKKRLYEFTTSVAADLKDFVLQHHTLRGVEVTLTRVTKKRNSKLSIEFAEANLREADLIPEPDLVEILCRVFSTRLPEEEDQQPTVKLREA